MVIVLWNFDIAMKSLKVLEVTLNATMRMCVLMYDGQWQVFPYTMT